MLNNKKKSHVYFGLLLAALTCVLQSPASAQTNAEILEGVRDCQRVIELSARLACYDRLLPPGAEANNNPQPAMESSAGNNVELPVLRTGPGNTSAPIPGANAEPPASREAELEATVAELEQRLQVETAARIIEVERPGFRDFRLVAEDGRVFVQTNATTITRWPDTPFDVEIDRGVFGVIYLVIPDRSGRIRVSLEE